MRENHQARKGTTLQGTLKYIPSAGYISPSCTTLFFKKEMLTLGDLCNKLGNELLSHLLTAFSSPPALITHVLFLIFFSFFPHLESC